MATALIQQATGTGGAGVATATLTTSSGNTLIAIVSNASGATNAFTLTDDKGNTWTRASQGYTSGSTNTRIEIWSAPITTAGVTLVTATSGSTGATLTVQEWSDILNPTLDIASTQAGTVTNTVLPTSSGASTTNAADVVVAAINYNTNSGARTHTHDNTGGIWTEGTIATTGSTVGLFATSIVAATGTYDDSWTASSTVVWGWATAAFKAAAVAGGSNDLSAISKQGWR